MLLQSPVDIPQAPPPFPASLSRPKDEDIVRISQLESTENAAKLSLSSGHYRDVEFHMNINKERSKFKTAIMLQTTYKNSETVGRRNLLFIRRNGRCHHNGTHTDKEILFEYVTRLRRNVMHIE